MTDYDNSNSGALFKNEKKVKPTQPDAKGVAEIFCPHCKKDSSWWVSAWTKTIQQGKKAGQRMQSLAFTPQEPYHKKEETASNLTEEEQNIADDDIPF